MIVNQERNFLLSHHHGGTPTKSRLKDAGPVTAQTDTLAVPAPHYLTLPDRPPGATACCGAGPPPAGATRSCRTT